VSPDDFVNYYNVAQAITAPVLAVSTNSPMIFGKRLWHETRIALFQQSVDTRTSSEHLREMSGRVMFGNHWLEKSILDIYKEDISRFRVLLSTDLKEDVFEKLKNGVTPKLNALQVHNSTVYRWNRPCYGISPGGKPHLRIENRIFPAGPTIVDEMASAAFWLGLMNGFHDQYGDVSKLMPFEAANSNFFSAARTGLNCRFNWLNDKQYSAPTLINKELVPLAREGLKKANINKDDIDR
jgi:hypothetical protein